MKVRPPTPVDPGKKAEIEALLSSRANLDEVIDRMRLLGLNKIESIKLLRDRTGVALGEAKEIVHLSPAWGDRFDSDNGLHDAVERAAESL